MASAAFEPVPLGGGRTTDLHLLQFGTDGRLTSPEAARAALAQLTAPPGPDGPITDVFIFSHGWNNQFDVADRNYRRFIAGMVSQAALSPGAPPCNPLLIGVIWPSTSLVLPWEEGPQIAAGGSGEPLSADEARAAVQRLVDDLPAEDPDDASQRPTASELLAAWARLDARDAGTTVVPPDPDAFGDIAAPAAAAPAAAAPDDAAPEIAGLLGKFDPRNLARMASLWTMKDRAGKVGSHGVSPLLRQILSISPARVHLVGHSFGARVVLSALCFAPLSRPVRSVLLLQPAINRWCFATDVVGKGRPGGYHPALQRVELPILSTRSNHDLPLHEVFHLAVRGSSLGEPDIAAVGDTFRYGALGGYGPDGVAGLAVTRPALPAGTPYDLSGPARLIAVDGTGSIGGRPAIGGHSDISNAVTWWALRTLLTQATETTAATAAGPR